MTVSTVKPIVQYITEKYGDSALTKEMKERMKVDLELRYSDSDIDQLLSIASFLDPRFKLGYVDDRESILEVKKQLSELVSENETVAQKYLCVCATSIPAERIFSIAGQIVSDRRSALKPDKVDQLVFLARNLNSLFYMYCFLFSTS